MRHKGAVQPGLVRQVLLRPSARLTQPNQVPRQDSAGAFLSSGLFGGFWHPAESLDLPLLRQPRLLHNFGMGTRTRTSVASRTSMPMTHCETPKPRNATRFPLMVNLRLFLLDRETSTRPFRIGQWLETLSDDELKAAFALHKVAFPAHYFDVDRDSAMGIGIMAYVAETGALMPSSLMDSLSVQVQFLVSTESRRRVGLVVLDEPLSITAPPSVHFTRKGKAFLAELRKAAGQKLKAA